MPNDTERPKRTPKDDGDGFVETHPAYACIEVARVTGSSGPLFGSALPNHDSFIELRIRRASRHVEPGMDKHHPGEALMNIRLSYAQFVEIMGQIDRSGGVPATISRIRHPTEGMRYLPGIEWFDGSDGTATSEAVRHAQERVEEVANRMGQVHDEVKRRLAGAKVSQKNQEYILEPLRAWARDTGGLGFLLGVVREQTERLVTSARLEVEGVMATVLYRLGLRQSPEERAAAFREGMRLHQSEREKVLKELADTEGKNPGSE